MMTMEEMADFTNGYDYEREGIEVMGCNEGVQINRKSFVS